jgi:uncharacterized protein (TIGR02611 family)
VQRVLDVVRFIGRNSRRVGIAVVGAALIVAGLVLLVVPGPGTLLLLAGLGVLATEFAWAAMVLEKAKDRAQRAKGAVQEKRRQRRDARGSGGSH